MLEETLEIFERENEWDLIWGNKMFGTLICLYRGLFN